MRAPQDIPRREPRRRGTGPGRTTLVIVALVAVVVIFSLRGIAGFYTDYLWYSSLGRTQVFKGVLGAKSFLVLASVSILFALMWGNLAIADRLAPKFRPAGPEEQLIERYREFVGPRVRLTRTLVALFWGLVAGVSAGSQWNEWILFRNYKSFGIKDPQFHKDVGWYVFRLPFLQYVVSWAFFAVALVLVMTVAAHYLNGGIRVQSNVERVTPQVKAHISVLLAVLALIKAVSYYLNRFQLTISTRGTVDGATYTDVKVQLPVFNLLILISLTALALFIVNIWRRGWVLPGLALAMWFLVTVIAGTIVPQIVQNARVVPSESSKERPYIQRNIAATRAAMGFTDLQPDQFNANTTVTQQDLLDNRDTVEHIRLWDPAADKSGRTFSASQQLTGFYRLRDVDVDRYVIDGQVTEMVLSAREIDTGSIPQKSWEAGHLTYTHGYGVVAAPANRGDSGLPIYLDQGIPQNSEQSLTVDQPAIYFGENQGQYSIVNTKRSELLYQGSNSQPQLGTYGGKDGVGIGSFVRRAAFALRFSDVNPLISGNITGSSRIIFNRNIVDRVHQLAPFLSFDSDPYVSVVDGKVEWIIDAYTTTGRYPYAQRGPTDGLNSASDLRKHRFNYVRNSVKATVDAYDGTVTFYIVDQNDPIIQAYANAFPSLFSSSPAPADLAAHFRYPEDIFTVQTTVWGRYHQQDPDTFYNNSDRWLVAPDPNVKTTVTQPASTTVPVGNAEPERHDQIPAYYLLMKLPGDDKLSFVLFRPFVPFAGSNSDPSSQKLTAFMTGTRDGGAPASLKGFQMSSTLPDGPANVVGAMDSNIDLSKERTLLGTGGSEVIDGNLLVVPIGNSLIYVRPLYVRASNNDLVKLARVVVKVGNNVGFDTDLGGALRKAGFPNLPADYAQLTTPPPDTTGTTPPSSGGSGTTTTTIPGASPPPTTAPQTVEQLIAAANTQFAAADALKAAGLGNPNDLASYVAALQAGEALVQQAQALIGQQGGTATPTTTTTIPSTTLPTSGAAPPSTSPPSKGSA
jgi:uncharacterized protein